MKITKSKLPEVLLIEPEVYSDERGVFLETWNKEKFSGHGFPAVSFVQDNVSVSHKGVLRGLHYQLNKPQGKLISVTSGAMFDVAVDIRVGSPNFGNWVGHELSVDNRCELWIPEGFAHGFVAITDDVCVNYKCTRTYDPEDDRGILWCDSLLEIDWNYEVLSISEKDKNHLPLNEVMDCHLPKYVIDEN
ncbi:MAG: dTDP-4-dehydrorhamnose 3,5-epimerase [Candidatus Thiodiazotropha sp. (ex Monitilora ramsayi)]|nr:dTDP-4-dehydrorhamnose 3,5-epimerase [Candidatus Thiodiazotropha sp. (ex Monitilora ramsayi)]